VLEHPEDAQGIGKVREQVAVLTRRFPVYD